MSGCRCGLALAVAMLAASAGAQQPTTYAVDASRSRIEIHVYKEGFFKMFAHDHQVSARKIAGTVRLDTRELERSSVSLSIEARSLAVDDPGVREKERQEVQANMESAKVLDVEHYPEIRFSSTGISDIKGGGPWSLVLTGELMLHGVVKRISLPLQVRREANAFRAQGETSLLQTDYGMTPIRIGGGTVKVKNRVTVKFDIVATP